MQNFPCVYLIFTRILAYGCKIVQIWRTAALQKNQYSVQTLRATSPQRARKCRDAINRVSTNNHSKSYRRCVQRLNESPFSVQTERAPSPRRTRKCTDAINRVSTNNHSKSYRRCVQRPNESPFSVQTEHAPSLQQTQRINKKGKHFIKCLPSI